LLQVESLVQHDDLDAKGLRLGLEVEFGYFAST
jgi:hypothetical protein